MPAFAVLCSAVIRRLAFFIALFFAVLALAEAPPTPISIRAETSAESGLVFVLEWDAVPNSTYLIQAGNFGDTPGLNGGDMVWKTIDAITPSGNQGVFKLTPEKVEAGSEQIRRAQFFQLV